MLTDLEANILRVCNGEVAPLPYDGAQALAERRLADAGFIRRGYEDDQPTAWITDAGRAALATKSNT